MMLVGSIYSIQNLDELTSVYVNPSAGKCYYVNAMDGLIYEKMPNGQTIETADFDFLAKKFQAVSQPVVTPTPTPVVEPQPSAGVVSDINLTEKRVKFLIEMLNPGLVPEDIKY